MPVATGRALPPGTLLDGYEIVEAVAERAGTIDYHVRPAAGGALLLLTEYMPAQLAGRDAAAAVAPASPASAPAYQRGLAAFVDEARALQRCSHAALPKLLAVGTGRGTAWCVQPLPDGEPLSAVRAARRQPYAEPELRRLLETLLDALAVWHREAGLHGSINAATLRLRADGSPLLPAPGAADRVVAAAGTTADRIAALMTSTEPSFAPAEQIVATADLPLGLSADLYAVAGVARFCITGELPPPALERPGARAPLADVVQRLQREHLAAPYDAALLATIEAALAPRPADRPQNVAQFRARLAASPGAGAAAGTTASLRARLGGWPVLAGGGIVVAVVLAAALMSSKVRVAAPPTTDGAAASAPPAAVAAPAVVVVPAYPTAGSAPSARPAAQPGRVAASPREACSSSADAALLRCMRTRCGQSQWKAHAECEQLRRTGRVD